jgi:hypothetical protein
MIPGISSLWATVSKYRVKDRRAQRQNSPRSRRLTETPIAPRIFISAAASIPFFVKHLAARFARGKVITVSFFFPSLDAWIWEFPFTSFYPAWDIIPEEVTMGGTVRTFDLNVQALVERRLREIAQETAKVFGASCSVEYVPGYPAVVNDATMVDFATGVAKRVLGEGCLRPFEPIMGGEDFANYLQKVPGAFIFLGASDGREFPHHHPAFDIDEKALPIGALLNTSLALEFLGVEAA